MEKQRVPMVIIASITVGQVRTWLMRTILAASQEVSHLTISYQSHPGYVNESVRVQLAVFQAGRDVLSFWFQGEAGYFEIEVGRNQIPDVVRRLDGSLDTFSESDPEEIVFKVRGWRYPGKLPEKIVFQEPPRIRIVDIDH